MAARRTRSKGATAGRAAGSSPAAAVAPDSFRNGGRAYAEQGVNGGKGRRFFSIAGDVKRPGVYEVPMGMTLRELIMGEEYCQGMLEDRPLKGFAPSGPSGGFLPARPPAARLPREPARQQQRGGVA